MSRNMLDNLNITYGTQSTNEKFTFTQEIFTFRFRSPIHFYKRYVSYTFLSDVQIFKNNSLVWRLVLLSMWKCNCYSSVSCCLSFLLSWAARLNTNENSRKINIVETQLS